MLLPPCELDCSPADSDRGDPLDYGWRNILYKNVCKVYTALAIRCLQLGHFPSVVPGNTNSAMKRNFDNVAVDTKDGPVLKRHKTEAERAADLKTTGDDAFRKNE